MKQIPCKHFNYGEGDCPFGASCFYQHVYPDGTIATANLRKVNGVDEGAKIIKEVSLWDFIETKVLRASLFQWSSLSLNADNVLSTLQKQKGRNGRGGNQPAHSEPADNGDLLSTIPLAPE